MTSRLVVLAVSLAGAVLTTAAVHGAAAPAATGTIIGHVRLTGPSPGNPMIRMGLDPMCASLNAGARPFQPIVLRSADGGLANVLVDLQGTFPATKPPAEPVTVDQHNCMYSPRVMGARVGQTLRIRNQDAVFHNVHSSSGAGNDFNFSQPKAGLTKDIALKGPDPMLRLKCDVHSWMAAYVRVEPHGYFDVSAADGSFTIKDAPAGRHTIRVWHERYGELTAMVTVAAGKTVTSDFAYTGHETPARSHLRDLSIPGTLDGAVGVLALMQ